MNKIIQDMGHLNNKIQNTIKRKHTFITLQIVDKLPLNRVGHSHKRVANGTGHHTNTWLQRIFIFSSRKKVHNTGEPIK